MCTNGNGNVIGCGVVFELSPGAKGRWRETVLYAFQNNGSDGVAPTGSVVQDAAGSVYGTTYVGGPYYYGTVFKLTPGRNGKWDMTALWEFDGGSDGAQPWGGPVVDAAGELYGTTAYGGDSDMGTLFKLAPDAANTWKETVLLSFSGGDGRIPTAPLSEKNGRFYSTTNVGGNANACEPPFGCGLVFEFTP